MVSFLVPVYTSERTLLRSDFPLQKNQLRAPSFLLFREKSRAVRLLVCKRTRDGSQSLPTFHDIAPSAQPKSLAATAFADKSCKNTRIFFFVKVSLWTPAPSSSRTLYRSRRLFKSHRLTYAVACPLAILSRFSLSRRIALYRCANMFLPGSATGGGRTCCPSPQKVTLRLCCLLVNARTTLRLAINFLRVRLRCMGVFLNPIISLRPNQSTNSDTKTAFHFGGLFLRSRQEPQYSYVLQGERFHWWRGKGTRQNLCGDQSHTFQPVCSCMVSRIWRYPTDG